MLRNKFLATALLTASAFSVTGCGYTQEDRALSGAGLGAAAGAATAAVTDGSVAGGAIVGGLGGGLIGAVTNPNQVNAGTPVWKR